MGIFLAVVEIVAKILVLSIAIGVVAFLSFQVFKNKNN